MCMDPVSLDFVVLCNHWDILQNAEVYELRMLHDPPLTLANVWVTSSVALAEGRPQQRDLLGDAVTVMTTRSDHGGACYF